MTMLYNCHTDGDQFRITKFGSLGNVESSYLCTVDECECPAGFRPSCRHRHMLPRFLAKGAVNTFYFYDYERQGWVTNEPGSHLSGDPVDDLPTEPVELEITPQMVADVEEYIDRNPSLAPSPEPTLRRRI